MEEHFLNTLFTLAKNDGKKPCLAFFHQDQYYELPRWWVRSKVKHFALGLLHHEAQSEENLYLSSELSPNRVYAELAGLLLGLRIVSVPNRITPEALQELLEKYPAHYFYASPSFFTEFTSILNKQKITKLWISEPGYTSPLKKMLTFREVFNAGIIHEDQHYQSYRNHQTKLQESALIGIDWNHEKGPILSEIEWSKLAQWIAEIKKRQPRKKAQKIWAQINLNHSLDRAFGLYAPLAMGHFCLCLPVQEELPKPLSWNPPHQIYLRPESWQTLIKKFPAKPKRAWNLFAQISYRWKRRQFLGKNLRKVWFPPHTSLIDLRPRALTKIQLAVVSEI